ncbi:bacillithiol biosynthesis cysteine-adding enzyme BshC [Membranihabitans maritimus]|uniref:bacillithiol biosynthesis cysteine-adding enzyme BshC n=1 Tax=Membranihabitans maritimus TaxID=2904244 RepID=UPI001F014633|nr:bacillithiol biosynthesis cysteine-adding enzyme BshC [Membranihabitans maritimus]
MNTLYFDFKSIGKFSDNDIAYSSGNKKLEPFYSFFPSQENLLNAAEKRKNFTVDREVLVAEITRQYKGFTDHEEIFTYISKLKDPNVFTITTAHQPNLLTGPLYFIYKCLSAIKASGEFNKRNSQYETIPILVLGGEDHDFEELNHLRIFGKPIVWEDEQGGAIGRYKTASLQPIIDEIYQILGDSENAQLLKGKIEKAFNGKENYGQSMQHFVHELLGHLGILVVSMDNKAFKKRMIPYFKDDLLNKSSHRIVNEVQESFSEAGFDKQAFVRPINFFYLTKNSRDRIEENNGTYSLVNSDNNWSQDELLHEIETNPENFSPNVILRPIYQEVILPNLAYVGGGGEISYWLERLSQFEELKVFFPMLIRRDSIQLISNKDLEILQEYHFSIEDLFLPDHKLTEKYLSEFGRDEIDISKELQAIDELEKKVQEKAEVIDQSLVARIGAQFAKFKNDLQGVEKRLKKTEKQSHDRNIKKINRIKSKLFPNNGLQERSDNFMSWYILHGEGFFQLLLEAANPFDTRMKTIEV